MSLVYSLSFPQPHTHCAEVMLEWYVPAFSKDQDWIVKMPVWTPGSYLIREYAKNVIQAEASDEAGNRLPSQKIAKNAWAIAGPPLGKIRFWYRVYGFELSVRHNWISEEMAFICGAATFVWLEGQTQTPGLLRLSLPSHWPTAATGLPMVGKGEFAFQDYDQLVDSPLMLGQGDELAWQQGQIPYRYVFFGHKAEALPLEQLQKDTPAIVEAATQIFGKNPLSDYHILVQMTDQQKGGLEHLNSTALQYTRTGLETPEGYEDFLSLVAHEYFHIWNVKRLRPAPLGPFDYERENYTTLLWQAEGFTSYYEKLILKKAGLITQEAYLDSLSKKINQIESQPGQARQSLAESSWDAWIKAYRPDENSANATISYYIKGAVVAMLLDVLLIAQTEGQACLDEGMQDLYARYYEQANRGFSEEELKASLENIAQISLDDFFARYIHQTQALPYVAYFDKLGIDFLWETPSSHKPYWGMVVEGKTIRQVWEGGPAHRDGLSAFDQIVAINGISPPSLANWLEKQKIGSRHEYTVLREGLLKTVFVNLDQTPPPICQIKPRPEAPAIQKRMQARFFRE